MPTAGTDPTVQLEDLAAGGERLASSAEMNGPLHAPVTDRVRANTWVPVNDRLDSETQLRMREAAAPASSDELTRRITQLDYEWEFKRHGTSWKTRPIVSAPIRVDCRTSAST